jgi:4-amino-4-deoxy-L-arabinose transferase-like glycosyltransferase
MRARRDLALVVLLTVAVGASWAALTPTFHTTDEPAHFAYVQSVAELGHPPRQISDTGILSAEQTCWYDGLRATQVRFAVDERPPWSARERRALEDRCEDASRRHDGAMYHAFQPPGYYMLSALGYEAGGGLSLPTRLLFVRLISVLLAAVAVACTYLLVRELVPGSPWPPRAGALALAFQPVFMFNEAAVNPDALVVAVAAAIAWTGARAWRRGLTTQRSLALGLLVGVGLWSKANFLLLLPSVALLAVALVVAARGEERVRRAARIAAAALVAVACLGVYALLSGELWDRTLTYRQPAYGGDGGGVGQLLSFAWQFFLPPLPFMTGLYDQPPAWAALVEGVTGRLGWWNDYGLSPEIVVVTVAGGAAIAAGALIYVLPRLRRRPWPILVAATCGFGFLAALVVADYQYSLSAGTSGFEGRYVLPIMPLWGVVVACSVAAVPGRWRPAMTGLLASAFVAHTGLAVAATLSRYYL